MNEVGEPLIKGSPRGMTAVGILLLFGSAMAFLAGTTFVWPGTYLDRVWVVNRLAYNELAPAGKAVGIPFLALSLILAIAGIGWFRRRVWAWWLAVGVIGAQIVGGFVNVLLGRIVEASVGVPLASALLFYLLRAKVRAAFQQREPRAGQGREVI
jgi:hypothetical protein